MAVHIMENPKSVYNYIYEKSIAGERVGNLSVEPRDVGKSNMNISVCNPLKEG